MGVYINMEMPTSCYDCPCNKDDGFGFFTCGVTKAECDFIRLPSNCPLVPVPPHGRLIDADAVEKQIDYVANIDWNKKVGASGGMLAALEIVEDAPTIIPAEEGDT